MLSKEVTPQTRLLFEYLSFQSHGVTTSYIFLANLGTRFIAFVIKRGYLCLDYSMSCWSDSSHVILKCVKDFQI